MSDKKHKERKLQFKWLTLYWRIVWGLVLLVFLVLLTVLIVWLVLRPTKPKFYLQDASVTFFNASSEFPNLISVSIQVVISTRNSNGRVGVYYDRLDVYAAYMSQQITPATPLPPTYQGHKDVLLWSPFLCGVNVPIAPYLAASLAQDKSDGLLILRVKILGRVRWKVGSWTSNRYRLTVDCPALLSFSGDRAVSGNGYYPSPLIRFQRTSSCSVSV
ncbi:unnamed protein product [Spirodela intermedia]|uniref:Late embryogenesis abundant protein LEA-2 subgroup domain-containing protein n=1 Tax=Spirodela intermedia TaxID=51605 RepID=A0ABN7E7P7_SPIIN|nr:unnamed protein product [Spirodela intermedia]